MKTRAELLLETARRGELHHALILHGPSADAQRALAVRIAQTLNCLEGTTGDDCSACERTARRIHPDVHFIEVGSERKMISVDQIRDILEGASFRPYEGRNKVFIIDPADALSVSGSNSLLKTLEEPTPNTTFLLLTRTPDLLLQTIQSRSQLAPVPGEIARDEELARFITTALTRFAEHGESTALLAIAAAVADRDNVKDSIALLGETLCEAVASGRYQSIPRERLLAAADGTMAAVRNMVVNADVRMVVEQALAELVV